MSDDGRFGGHVQAPGGGEPAGQDFGYFAGGAPVGAPSQFGGSPAAPAPTQFGAAPVVASPFGGGAQVWTPPAHSPPAGPLATLRSSAGGRFVLRAGAGLALALVLGVLGVGRFSGLFDGGPTIPDTLGGLAASSDSTMRDEIQDAADQVNDGFRVSMAGEVYGDSGTGHVHMLFVGRGDMGGAEAELSGPLAEMGGGAVRRVGTSICADITGAGAAACARISDDQLVLVVGGGSSAEQTAELVEEAWSAQ